GFSKINNADRFGPDISEEEATRFGRSYRPVRQLDQQRIDYLYPAQNEADRSAERRYFDRFEDLIRDLRSRHIRVIVLKPPVPERVYRILPDEAGFDAELKAILDRQQV